MHVREAELNILLPIIEQLKAQDWRERSREDRARNSIVSRLEKRVNQNNKFLDAYFNQLENKKKAE